MPLLIERLAWERSRLHLGSTASVDVPDGMPHIGASLVDRWAVLASCALGGVRRPCLVLRPLLLIPTAPY